MNETLIQKRDELLAKYNKIPKTAPHDARRKKAFEDLMEIEDKILEELNK